MVSLRYFVLVLLTICCRELVAGQSRYENPYALPLVVVLLLGISLMTKFAALRAVHGATLAGTSFDWLARELFYASRLKIERLWCYGSPLVLLLLGWIQWSCTLEQSGWPQSLMLVLCFLPTLAFLLLLEMIAAQVDRIGKAGLNSSLMQTWLTRIRLGEFAGVLTCLMPVLLLALVSDLSLAVSTAWGVEQSLVSTICTIFITAVFILFFPAVLTAWSAGKAMPEALGQRIHQLVLGTGVSGIRAVLISSRGRWAGAAVVGWIPGFRRLWLGDGLVSGLTVREVDMVVLHELAHICRYHFLWRLMPVVWAMAAGAGIWLVGDYLAVGESLTTKLLAGLTSSWLLLAGLGTVARRCELDADQTACNLAQSATDWAASQSPAEVLSSALSKLLEGNSSSAITWLHPSLDQRLDSLDQWKSTGSSNAIPTA